MHQEGRAEILMRSLDFYLKNVPLYIQIVGLFQQKRDILKDILLFLQIFLQFFLQGPNHLQVN